MMLVDLGDQKIMFMEEIPKQSPGTFKNLVNDGISTTYQLQDLGHQLVNYKC